MRARVRALSSTSAEALEQDLQRRGLLLSKGAGGTPAPDSRNAFRLGSEVTGKTR